MSVCSIRDTSDAILAAINGRLLNNVIIGDYLFVHANSNGVSLVFLDRTHILTLRKDGYEVHAEIEKDLLTALKEAYK